MGRLIRRSVELAVEDVNRRGGVTGAPLVVIYEDDQDTQPGAIGAAKKLSREQRRAPRWSSRCSGSGTGVVPRAHESDRRTPHGDRRPRLASSGCGEAWVLWSSNRCDAEAGE